jgi:hypothetical protein
MHKKLLLVISILFNFDLISFTQGHARLLEPAARSSAWRKFPNSSFPVEYTDNQMNCGGFWKQWSVNGGKCSICGEDWSLPVRQYDIGGPKYTGLLVAEYFRGQQITVTVEVTANHLGYFEFRVCSLDSSGINTDATNECLDKNLMIDVYGNSRQLVTSRHVGLLNYRLILPAKLSCNHCVLQVIECKSDFQ